MSFAQITGFLGGVKNFAKGNSNSRQLVREIGSENVQATMARFDRTKIDPDGIRWKSLSLLTVMKKGHSSILIDTRRMRGSVKNSLVDVKDGIISIRTGAKMPYATSHQQPGGKSRHNILPRRAFLGYDKNEVDRIGREIIEALRRL